MAIKHLKDGEDFGDHPDHFPASFGYTGSAKSGGKHAPPHKARVQRKAAPPMQDAPAEDMEPDADDQGAAAAPAMAHGGHVHPHGHQPMPGATEQHEDGTLVLHHAHGGMTIHHPDGGVSHHGAQGEMLGGGHMAQGGVEHMHDPESELAHRARGGQMAGDEAEDRQMVTKAVHQHEEHDHKGEPETDLHLAHGGKAEHYARGGVHVGRPRIPRQMMPKAARTKSPFERAPTNPGRMPVARNQDPGGSPLGYGVEPSAEPDNAMADPGNANIAPAMRMGGRTRR